MKNVISIISLSLMIIFIGCKTKELTAEQQVKAEEYAEKIENRHFVFEANRAQPMSGKSINLTSSYYLKVTQDTIVANLPYYGRSYSAPTDPTDIGINFTSTDFLYSSNKKDNGTYEIKIEPKDIANRQNQGLTFFLNISSNGYASLSTSGTNRQSISFNGTVE